MTKSLRLLIFLLPILVNAVAQRRTEGDTTNPNDDQTRRSQYLTTFWETNGIYNQLYLYNADLGFITPPYLDAFAPKKYLLTSDVTPHYFVVASSRYRGSLVFTPRTKVRILDEPSQPIRTPSFMPALTYYLRMADNTQQYRYLTINATHHSNGQDGAQQLPNGLLNTYNGTFSTNFVELGFNWGRASPKAFDRSDSVLTARPPGRDIRRKDIISYGKLAITRHFSSDEVLSGRYGFTRLVVKFNRIQLREQLVKELDGTRQTKHTVKSFVAEKQRMTVSAQWIFGTLYSYSATTISRRLNLELTYYYRLPFQYANSYLYAAAGYYGQDPYNIYFNDQYIFARVGAAFGISVYKGRSVTNPVVNRSHN